MALPRTFTFDNPGGSTDLQTWDTNFELLTTAGNNLWLSASATQLNSDTGGADIVYRYVGETAPDDQSAKITIVDQVGTWSGGGPMVRVQANGDGYMVLYAGNAIVLQKKVSGSNSDIGSAVTGTYTGGDVIELRAVGTTLTVFLNGSAIITQTDSQFASGAFGIFAAGNTGPHFDNYIISSSTTNLPETFTAANGSPLSGSWTLIRGDIVIQSNGFISNSSGAITTAAMWVGPGGPSTNDHWAEVKLVTAGTSSTGGCGPAVRCSGTIGAGYAYIATVYWNGNYDIQRILNNTWSSLKSGSTTISWGTDVARLEVVGSTLTLKINGTTIDSVTDGGISTGVPGITSEHNSAVTDSPIGDDFNAGDMTADTGELLTQNVTNILIRFV